MDAINKFFNKYPDLKDFEKLVVTLFARSDIKGMFLCGSRSNKTKNKEKELSDFDFFLITSEKISKIQSLHYHIEDFRVELMFYEEEKFCNPSSYDNNLLDKLLNKSELIFSKNEKIKKSFLTFSKAKLKKGVSKSELDSMWFKIIWNILKVKSYEKKDVELAEIFSMQNYFFIGLLYGKLCGEPIYNLSESVKYMKETNFSFWKKYYDILNKKNKKKEIEKLIKFLPDSEKYLTKKSLIELDSFISPLTVVGKEDKIIVTYKKELDKIIIPTISFLEKSPSSINYYSIEGLSGVGKTTFLKKISSIKFFKFNEISKNNELAKKIKRLSNKKNKNFKANNFFLNEELERIKKFSKIKINILDRAIYSQIVYNYAKFKTYGQKDIFHLIKKLKKLEKNNFNYPKLIYLNCKVNFSRKSLVKKKVYSFLDETDEVDFIKNAKSCYDKINKILGCQNALEIKIPSERKISQKKIKNFIEKFHNQQVNFTIKEIEKYCKE